MTVELKEVPVLSILVFPWSLPPVNYCQGTESLRVTPAMRATSALTKDSGGEVLQRENKSFMFCFIPFLFPEVFTVPNVCAQCQWWVYGHWVCFIVVRLHLRLSPAHGHTPILTYHPNKNILYPVFASRKVVVCQLCRVLQFVRTWSEVGKCQHLHLQ